MKNSEVTIRIIQPVEREGYNGEPWKFKPGDIEENVVIDEDGCAVVDYG